MRADGRADAGDRCGVRRFIAVQHTVPATACLVPIITSPFTASERPPARLELLHATPRHAAGRDGCAKHARAAACGHSALSNPHRDSALYYAGL